ncbi:MAG TPA: hypothetical protein VGA98_00605 [Allosphingosinicella sp.]|jgi:hypothetical protein
MRALIVAAALLLWPCAAAGAPSVLEPMARASLPAPELLKLASDVRRTGPKLARLWPGYWPPEQAFILYRPGEGALLIAGQAGPGTFAPLAAAALPKALRGRAWFHPGDLTGMGRPFVLDYPIGGGRTAVLVLADQKADALSGLIFHEQFHDYQGSAFKGRRGSQFVAPKAVADRVAFAAAAETERRVLAAALEAKPGRTRHRLLHQYLALRRERESGLAANVLAVERQFEMFEGTAKFIDRAAAAFAPGAEKSLTALVAEVLREDLNAMTQPYLTAWFRTRGYGVGAALTYLLRELDPKGWRTAIEGGVALDERLAALTRFDTVRDSAALATSARATFGYAATHAAFEPRIRAAEKKEIKSAEEFHALGVHRVVLEWRPPAKNGGKGVEMGFSTGPGGMVLLGEAHLVLPDPEMLNMTFPSVSVTVKGLPFMSEGNGTRRYTILLPSAPKVNGRSGLAAGDHALDRLTVTAGGLEMRVDRAASVVVREGETIIRVR